MVGIRSTIGNNGNTTRLATGRNFVVEDESRGAPVALTPDQIPQDRMVNPAVAQGLRRQALEQQEQVEQRNFVDARRRIELLTGLGRKTKDVLIEGITFTLRSLKAFEQNELAQVIAAQDRISLPNGQVSFTSIGMYNIKVEALGHSLHLVDGQLVDIVLGTVNSPYEEQVAARKELIIEMDGEFINHLFIEFEKLSAETKDGYAPKTTEEVKEVVDTIRKSGQDT
jgi:hypothetical protein